MGSKGGRQWAVGDAVDAGTMRKGCRGHRERELLSSGGRGQWTVREGGTGHWDSEEVRKWVMRVGGGQ
jgi:hypothetical protein